MKQENKMKKEKKDIPPAINIEMIDKNNNHNDMTKKTAKKNKTNTTDNNNTTKKKKIKKKHQLSCYNVFGLRGFLIYILMIAITVFHFIVGSSIPPELSSYIHGRKFELYLSGNKKLCNSNEYKNSEACTPLCSEYCYSRNHKNNGCDPACNSKECNYDGGECVRGAS